MLIIAQATDVLAKYLGDLQEKASDLNELDQGGAIYTALENLEPAYFVSRDISS